MGELHYSQCFTRFVIDLITMILHSSYTQSVLSVYPIYTEDIIERYLIKSVNISSGRAGKGGTGGTSGTGETGETSGTGGTSGTSGTGGTGGTSGTGGTGGTGVMGVS